MPLFVGSKLILGHPKVLNHSLALVGLLIVVYHGPSLLVFSTRDELILRNHNVLAPSADQDFVGHTRVKLSCVLLYLVCSWNSNAVAQLSHSLSEAWPLT